MPHTYPITKMLKTDSKKKHSKLTKNEIGDEQLSNYSELKKSYIIDFFKTIDKSLRNHGHDKVIAVLSNLDIQSDLKTKNLELIVEHICECVTEDYKKERVKKQDLFVKSKRGDVTSARKMAIILIKQFIDVSDNKIGKYFGRSRQVVFYTMQEFKDLNTKNKQDVEFLNRHDKLSKKISNYINDSNLNNGETY